MSNYKRIEYIKTTVSELKNFDISSIFIDEPENKMSKNSNITIKLFLDFIFEDLILWGDKDIEISIDKNHSYNDLSFELSDAYPFHSDVLYFSFDMDKMHCKKDFEEYLTSQINDAEPQDLLSVRYNYISSTKSHLKILYACLSVLKMDILALNLINNYGIGNDFSAESNGYILLHLKRSNFEGFSDNFFHLINSRIKLSVKFKNNSVYLSFGEKEKDGNFFMIDFSNKNFFEVQEKFDNLLKIMFESEFEQKVCDINDSIVLIEMSTI